MKLFGVEKDEAIDDLRLEVSKLRRELTEQKDKAAAEMIQLKGKMELV
jgi:hypothetical protein